MNIKKVFWNILGCISVGCAFIGVVTPGIPYSPFVVFAAYCFSKGSERLHRWIYNHKIFGPFLTNWSTKRVFPQKARYLMLTMMSISLIMMFIGGVKPIGIVSTAVFMALVAVWAWKYPNTPEEYDRRKVAGKKIGWIK